MRQLCAIRRGTRSNYRSQFFTCVLRDVSTDTLQPFNPPANLQIGQPVVSQTIQMSTLSHLLTFLHLCWCRLLDVTDSNLFAIPVLVKSKTGNFRSSTMRKRRERFIIIIFQLFPVRLNIQRLHRLRQEKTIVNTANRKGSTICWPQTKHTWECLCLVWCMSMWHQGRREGRMYARHLMEPQG